MVKTALHLLHIEDDPGDAHLIRRMLGEVSNDNRFDVTRIDRLSDAEHVLKEHSFDAVLLDLNLIDSSGPETVRAVKLMCPHIPIIVLTASGQEEVVVEALQDGAQDFFVKGKEDSVTLQRAILYAISRIKLEERLFQKANFDELTGLVTRGLFLDRLRQARLRSDRSGHHFALLYLDLDKFKDVNDILGHWVGDLLLKEVGKRIRRCVREHDTVARLGGDEFAILLEDVREPVVKDTATITTRIVEAVAQRPYMIMGHQLDILVSIGIALYPMLCRNDEQGLVREADRAMYTAKRGGGIYFKFAMPIEDDARVEEEYLLKKPPYNAATAIHKASGGMEAA